jgi:hypothetical protein
MKINGLPITLGLKSQEVWIELKWDLDVASLKLFIVKLKLLGL